MRINVRVHYWDGTTFDRVMDGETLDEILEKCWHRWGRKSAFEFIIPPAQKTPGWEVGAK